MRTQSVGSTMSSFTGDALRGSCFFLFGFWWSVKYPLMYLNRKLNAESQKNLCFQRLDVFEGTVKAFFALAGILAEQFVPDGPHLSLYSAEDQSWVKLGNWQYTTMYFFFGLSGIMEVLSYRLKLPLGLDRLLLSVALFIEGFLFCFHNYNVALDQHLHSLLLIAIFGGTLCALLEVCLLDHIVLEIIRTSLFILQGTWFWQIGFVLHPPWGGPGWDQTDRGVYAFLNVCFCWHYAAALLVVAANFAASHCYNQACQLKLEGIDVELDIGCCLRKFNRRSDPVLLPENGLDEK
ncbi:transmembrane protein 45B [Alligator mississippiensis]|uniref:Transmembrane protein 45B n=1 Tax=Alligator mississippiensis TaxID=8496 RepID=A0A151NG21_ALLMI|nr:transmembrane protein 45B [Alligator mississippiensis]